MQSLRRQLGRNSAERIKMTQELMKYVLEQASGVVIALVLIVRIEAKLDGLTAAIMQLSGTKPSEKTHDQF